MTNPTPERPERASPQASSQPPAPFATQGEPVFDVVLHLVSNPVYLSGARDLVTNIAGRLGFDDLSRGKLALAIDEALCNVIRHGYDERDDQPITVRIGFSPADDPRGRHLVVVIEDDGKQIDPAEIVGRDLDDVRPGGLGVHIIREIMDHVSYEQRNPAGMRLTMKKALPVEDTDPPASASAGGVRYGGRR